MENVEEGMQTVELDGFPSSVSRLFKLDKGVYKVRVALDMGIGALSTYCRLWLRNREGQVL